MPALQPKIRCSQGDDLKPVLALLQGAGLPTGDILTASDLQLWVMEVDARLVGVIGMQRFGACALLRSLAIFQGHQGRGLGRQLVAQLEREARSDGVGRLVLLTETAEKFFRAIGYEVTDRLSVPAKVKQSAEFGSLCPTSAVCMTKSLAVAQVGSSHG